MSEREQFLDRLIKRLDRLHPSLIQQYVLKLIRQKGVFERIFQSIQEGILIIDAEFKIHYVNNAAIQMLGLPLNIRERDNSQCLSRYLRDLDWQQLTQDRSGQAFGAKRHEIEIFYPKHRFLQFYLLPYETEIQANSVTAMNILILHDITEEHQRTASDIETEKLNAMTMLAAGVAHEIGNPLNSLSIHLQLLDRCFDAKKEKDKADEHAYHLLNIAKNEVQRLSTLISQFLKAIHPTKLELRSLNLNKLLEEALELMEAEIKNSEILVELDIADTGLHIQGDDIQLKQVFYNLIHNAFQAMPEGGCLRVSVDKAQDDSVIIHFSDTGVGIAADELATIFTPYYTSKKDGSGLGLMIVERIVREHGAKLGVESEPGRGTVFSITFPCYDKHSRLLQASSQLNREIEQTSK